MLPRSPVAERIYGHASVLNFLAREKEHANATIIVHGIAPHDNGWSNEKGFIDIAERGNWHDGKLTKYSISYRWMDYGTDQYRFRYSYDAKLARADINIPNMGAHEISLIIIFESLDKSMKHSAIKCPKI